MWENDLVFLAIFCIYNQTPIQLTAGNQPTTGYIGKHNSQIHVGRSLPIKPIYTKIDDSFDIIMEIS